MNPQNHVCCALSEKLLEMTSKTATTATKIGGRGGEEGNEAEADSTDEGRRLPCEVISVTPGRRGKEEEVDAAEGRGGPMGVDVRRNPPSSQDSNEQEWVHIYGASPSHRSPSLRSSSHASPFLASGAASSVGGCGVSEFGASLLGNLGHATSGDSDGASVASSQQLGMCKRGRFMSLPLESCVRNVGRGLRSKGEVLLPIDKMPHHSRCLSCPEEDMCKFDERRASPSCCHKRKGLLLPQLSIPDPNDPLAAREKCRNALIAELQRRKGFLQVQLGWLQREVSAWNIFALVRACNSSELHYLLERKLVDVNQRDYNGCTPLHVAALGGNESVVRVLISFGADITAIDNTGRTPLDWAAENRHSGVCRLLVAVTKHAQMKKEQRRHHVHSSRGNGSISPNYHGTPTCGAAATEGPSCGGNSPGMPSISLPSCKKGSASQSTVKDTKGTRGWGSKAPLAVSPGDSVLFSALPPDMVAQYRARDCLNRVRDQGAEGRLPNAVDDIANMSSSYTTVSDAVSLIVCMVGLPGRGKSFIGRRIARYLNWKGVPCRVFNVGNYRRRLLGVEGTCSADFYDPQNLQAKQMRDKVATLAFGDLIHFIAHHRVACGVFDATNTTKARRKYLLECLQQEAEKHNINCRVIFIESVCNDLNLITENILRAKCGNDDFKNVKDAGEVISAFYSRIAEYEKVYEQLDADEGISFIRIINAKHHVILHKIPCGLASLISFFLLNLHPVAHPIYIAVPGETVGDRKHIYGGDDRLTPLGEKFADALKRFILERDAPNMVVLHGTNPNVMNTLRPLEQALEPDSSDDGSSFPRGARGCGGFCVPLAELLCPLPGLDRINFGRFCGRTVKQVRTRYSKLCKLLYAGSPMGSGSYIAADDEIADPGKEKAQQEEPPLLGTAECASDAANICAEGLRRFLHVPNGADPRLSYCVQFPNGESCRQVNVRLEPALMAVMRVRGPVFVVASSVPAQGVLAFFADALPEMAPALRLPSHAVVEISVRGDITVHQLVKPCDRPLQPSE
ncbi:6-phosphofructo-2-kinase/fructose-2,6-biphospha tase,putative [Trypanosoma brucei gambiense DAL972]|uniref:6-phosphofructo-2-kinase/fructose-2,6-biphospha tase,putative n=1 Tax=Trypanosoma brucei gambiense (strain MHOM/CI/86/DAL972) TaxID=679716 RepID=C9ZKH4_TRYB9|nr:6-phosphofructo-2-kinase/fructose-2,6-biphospha tase,putative [Trypanosoma brucei gambiense DAL972]CBH09940.1 6-phosphofructo-2-kinase/fructose-2,6-biphospha tase,putative [Trypanosoma brucei gambiense DAL972]|eukprot:XP_011772231.1 6-phosphofructo-2-kinase/fructose-2,6-biphospha tase,putative [Trypanosoma brucei gambiense DAL972]